MIFTENEDLIHFTKDVCPSFENIYPEGYSTNEILSQFVHSEKEIDAARYAKFIGTSDLKERVSKIYLSFLKDSTKRNLEWMKTYLSPKLYNKIQKNFILEDRDEIREIVYRPVIESVTPTSVKIKSDKITISCQINTSSVMFTLYGGIVAEWTDAIIKNTEYFLFSIDSAGTVLMDDEDISPKEHRTNKRSNFYVSWIIIMIILGFFWEKLFTSYQFTRDTSVNSAELLSASGSKNWYYFNDKIHYRKRESDVSFMSKNILTNPSEVRMSADYGYLSIKNERENWRNNIWLTLISQPDIFEKTFFATFRNIRWCTGEKCYLLVAGLTSFGLPNCNWIIHITDQPAQAVWWNIGDLIPQEKCYPTTTKDDIKYLRFSFGIRNEDGIPATFTISDFEFDKIEFGNSELEKKIYHIGEYSKGKVYNWIYPNDKTYQNLFEGGSSTLKQ